MKMLEATLSAAFDGEDDGDEREGLLEVPLSRARSRSAVRKPLARATNSANDDDDDDDESTGANRKKGGKRKKSKRGKKRSKKSKKRHHKRR